MESSRETSPSPSTGERVKISEIMHNRNAVTRFPGAYHYEDIKTEGPVACHWSLSPEVAGFSVHGDLSATVVLECMRCLEPYQVPVNLEIDERYVLDSYVDRSEKEKELQSEDFYEVVKEDSELDLKDLAHQWLVMESENHPLCGREECRFS